MTRNHLPLIAALTISFGLGACSKKSLEGAEDLDEAGNTASESMQSMDESLGGGSLGASLDPKFLQGTALERALARSGDLLVSPAYAAACSALQFSACTNGVRTRTFGASVATGCTTGFSGVRTSGTATLTYIDSTGTANNSVCTAGILGMSAGNGVIRTIDKTMTGRRGATFSVSSTGVTAYDTSVSFGAGQKMVLGSGNTATVTVLGMNRKATVSGSELFNFSTKSSADFTFTGIGTGRANRKLTAGTLEIYHNKAQYKMSLKVKDTIGWSGDCDTPTSGSMEGTLSGSRTGTVLLTFTGCGTTSVTQTDSGESTTASGDSETKGTNG